MDGAYAALIAACGEGCSNVPQAMPVFSIFPDDLNKDFDPNVFAEERVEPKSFRNVFTSTLLWTMFIPLVMMITIHQQFIAETNRWADQQQAEITAAWGTAISEEFRRIESSADRLAALPFGAAQRVAEELYGRGIVNVREIEPSSPTSDPPSLKTLRAVRQPNDSTRIFIPGCSSGHCIELEVDVGAVLSSVWKVLPSLQIEGFLLDPSGRVLYATSGSPASEIPDPSLFEQMKKGVPYWRTVAPRNVAKIVSAAPVDGTDLVVAAEYPISQRDALLRRSMSMSGFLIVLSVFGSILAGFAASRPLAKSIEHLNEGVSSIQSGDAVEIAEKITLCGGPVELVRLGERFESMAKEIREKNDSLQHLTEELEERVRERTERLRRRNAELRALHFLLAPFQGSALDGISYAVHRIREINQLEVLSFIPAGHPIPQEYESFPVRLNGINFGFIATKSGAKLEEGVKSSINLLVDSIAIVLSNNQLLVSLTREQDTLRSALSSMTDGVALLSTSTGRLLYSNRTFKQLFSLTSHSRRSFGRLLKSRFASLQRIFEGGRCSKLELNLNSLQPSGVYHLATEGKQIQTIELRTFPIRTGLLAQQGKGLGIVVRDVSEEIYLSQMKEQLLSVVAHELKTPITSLRLQAETLSSQIGLSDDERDEILSDMREESVRLHKLIDDWLDLARLDEGMFAVEKRVTHIATAIDKAAKVTKLNYGITVKRTIADEAECFMFDLERITQVFINLFTNAARYGREGVSVVVNVAATRAGDKIRIVVQDNGMGIPPAKLPHIFERFYQADMRDRRLQGGSGLGLAIVKAIVEAHGGAISVESRVNAYTRFKLELPY